MEYKMDLLAIAVQGCDSWTIFVKNFISDIPLGLNTILQKSIINFLKSQAADLFANSTPIGTFSK